MKQRWDDFRTAIAFLTIFPVANNVAMDNRRLGRSMGLFPAVGLLLGLGLVVSNGLLSPLIPRAVLDCLLILLLILATGALHLDGIADMIDGLAASRDRETSLRIMKDSRVGAMGVVGLVMLLLLKYLCLFHIPLEQKSAALLLMPTAGRFSQVFLSRCSTYIRREGGTGSVFVDHVGNGELFRAGLTILLAVLLLFSFKGVVFAALLLVFTTLMMHYFERRLGGVTGDVLGAATEMTEVFSLLLILTIWG
ncbi:cobalamin-5'-phosphate synthase [Malonomonas rubra DSM 5091]|uniref:Adenosylcobinamide-GDP ribazoletransferase n=1 Tax=Malonomonas rubra DSM 5091 TaxID=1122189 RepID=A0A1M6GLD6_MALRU|nr:adenosylcobinamide-GDP ribazoletransferase [Malonomonas rubra]SHJ10768.1 cobalamin-5'-phosphate synthase [Malonomonas rubra DSM 5091]